MPDTPGPDPVHLIPLDAIDDNAIARDRAAIDPASLAELTASIAVNGLRQPVELFRFPGEDDGRPPYGLISGLRRLQVFRNQLALTDRDRYARIPAFVRRPASLAAALTAMVEENEVRAGLSPWERARIAVTGRDQEVFASIEEAVDTLYTSASRQKRSRLRAIAGLVEELDGLLTAPERLSENQTLRLAAALTRGFSDVIRTALLESSLTNPASQWQLLLPILAEAEREEPAAAPRDLRPGRPRRVFRPTSGLTIRRELTRDGYLLHLTGPDARDDFIEAVFDEIERLLTPTR